MAFAVWSERGEERRGGNAVSLLDKEQRGPVPQRREGTFLFKLGGLEMASFARGLPRIRISQGWGRKKGNPGGTKSKGDSVGGGTRLSVLSVGN